MGVKALLYFPLQAEPFRRFVDMVRSNSPEFEAQGRVLRLKQYISADVRPAAINAILEALAVNTLVEVLYIQNFEQVRSPLHLLLRVRSSMHASVANSMHRTSIAEASDRRSHECP